MNKRPNTLRYRVIENRDTRQGFGAGGRVNQLEKLLWLQHGRDGREEEVGMFFLSYMRWLFAKVVCYMHNVPGSCSLGA